ncbi:O-methyltransferase [Hoyosella rhizosphaerae]|uniref:O-methyltransferase n=1 Tax=Hoyosella rhizosphaerae TaxID=1755582 RepID=A0A916XB71_9ACTN|nr:O-methyltransferase [Hoyosella rhizosphaerae]MBN4926287.1 O-methyltransferase [Hoyosella rhizosphaerae]GGC60564.1 O-methyltransferase [Hoyosella rhizosphaerae]
MASSEHPIGSAQDVDAVEDFIVSTVVKPDDFALAALRRAAEHGLPSIEVMPNHGKFLQLLAQLRGARRILEIGTLGGFSTLSLARAVPRDGSVVTIEHNPDYAEVAKETLSAAHLGDVVDIRIGDARAVLDELQNELSDPDIDSELFDFVFIDADKENVPHYLTAALELCAEGAAIVLDNAVWHGAIIDPQDEAALGVRGGLELLGSHPHLDATVIQTVGTKGWDGFALALVNRT